jgi:hypothetical protein
MHTWAYVHCWFSFWMHTAVSISLTLNYDYQLTGWEALSLAHIQMHWLMFDPTGWEALSLVPMHSRTDHIRPTTTRHCQLRTPDPIVTWETIFSCELQIQRLRCGGFRWYLWCAKFPHSRAPAYIKFLYKHIMQSPSILEKINHCFARMLVDERVMPKAWICTLSADGVTNPIRRIPTVRPATPWALEVFRHASHLDLPKLATGCEATSFHTTGWEATLFPKSKSLQVACLWATMWIQIQARWMCVRALICIWMCSCTNSKIHSWTIRNRRIVGLV